MDTVPSGATVTITRLNVRTQKPLDEPSLEFAAPLKCRLRPGLYRVSAEADGSSATSKRLVPELDHDLTLNSHTDTWHWRRRNPAMD